MNQRPIKPQDRQNSPSSKTFSSTLQGFSSSLIKRFTIIDNLLATKFPSIQTLVLRQKKLKEEQWKIDDAEELTEDEQNEKEDLLKEGSG